MSFVQRKRLHFSATPASKMRAFSLIEVVATIALIAVLVTLTIGGLNNLDFINKKDKPVERLIITAVKSASFIAKDTGKFIELVYDKRGFFEISELESSKVVKRIFLKSAAEKKYNDDVKAEREIDISQFRTSDEVVFTLKKPEIIGKEKMDFPREDRQSIVFAPDGICNQFSVSVKSSAFPEPIQIDFDNITASPYGKK